MQQLGVEYMDANRRNDILLQIQETRTKEARVLEVVQSIPSWADRPFKADQENFQAAYNTYLASNPAVQALETRLATTPGPIWRELTPEEQAALNTWTKAVEQMYAYTNAYFPSETQQYIAQAALLAIAIGAFIAPIFLDEPEKGLALPFSLEPDVKFPTSPRPRRPGPAPATAAPTSFTPTSFSRIPGATGPSSPLRVQAEIMRPAASTAMPWRRPEMPGAPAAPGFRTFTRPLESTPIPGAAAAPISPVSPVHGPPTFPRFRRQ